MDILCQAEVKTAPCELSLRQCDFTDDASDEMEGWGEKHWHSSVTLTLRYDSLLHLILNKNSTGQFLGDNNN